MSTRCFSVFLLEVSGAINMTVLMHTYIFRANPSTCVSSLVEKLEGTDVLWRSIKIDHMTTASRFDGGERFC